MATKVGDRIKVESEKAGRPAREGVILEVIEATWGTQYRVRWDDGHESTILPHGGTVTVTHPEKPAAAEAKP
jgi:hypothetical protein